MKKLIIAFIITFVMIAVGLGLLLIYSITRGSDGFSFNFSNMKLVNTQSISLDAIDTITISYRSDDVVFYTSDTEELILKEYMNYTPNDSELSIITKNENELKIKNGKQKLHIVSFGMTNSRIELYLPASYLEKLSVETSSGNIVSDLTLNLSEYAATSSSGNIKVNEVYAGLISATASSGNITFQVAEGNRQFSTTSGNIEVLGGKGDSDITSSSGNITIENAVGYLKADASSGNIKITEFNGGGNIETSSGNIKLDLSAVNQDLDIQASSGNINVSLPSTTSFEFSSKTSSGNIRTFFDDMLSYNKKGNEAFGTVGANPNLNFTIETSHGNIRVDDN